MRRTSIALFCLSVVLLGSVSRAEIPQDVVNRLSFLIKAEVETQSRSGGGGGGMCSEDEVFSAADRKLDLMEQSLMLANSGKADKFAKLIEFFKEKMIYKCCEISGKGGAERPKGSGGRGFGRGGNKGGGGGGGGGKNRRGRGGDN